MDNNNNELHRISKKPVKKERSGRLAALNADMVTKKNHKKLNNTI